MKNDHQKDHHLQDQEVVDLVEEREEQEEVIEEMEVDLVLKDLHFQDQEVVDLEENQDQRLKIL